LKNSRSLGALRSQILPAAGAENRIDEGIRAIQNGQAVEGRSAQIGAARVALVASFPLLTLTSQVAAAAAHSLEGKLFDG
jgi:hypothetical protein